MNLTVLTENDQTLVCIGENRLDAAIATRFKDRMREVVVTGAKSVRIDMSNVDFMDSSGLGAMIAVHKAMPMGAGLILSGLTPNVLRVFRLTRMDSIFSIHPAVDETQEKRA